MIVPDWFYEGVLDAALVLTIDQTVQLVGGTWALTAGIKAADMASPAKVKPSSSVACST